MSNPQIVSPELASRSPDRHSLRLWSLVSAANRPTGSVSMLECVVSAAAAATALDRRRALGRIPLIRSLGSA